eukprot:508343-Pyramimonas_sp.AAC.1
MQSDRGAPAHDGCRKGYLVLWFDTVMGLHAAGNMLAPPFVRVTKQCNMMARYPRMIPALPQRAIDGVV